MNSYISWIHIFYCPCIHLFWYMHMNSMYSLIHQLFCSMISNICVKSYASMNLIATGYTRWIHLYLVYYKWWHLIYEFIYVMNSYILLSVYSSVVIHAYELYEFIEYMKWFVTWFLLFVWSHMWVWIWTWMDILNKFIYI